MTVQKLVVVVKNLDYGEVLERWQFNVECDKSVTENRSVYMPFIVRDVKICFKILWSHYTKHFFYTNLLFSYECFLRLTAIMFKSM